MKHRARMTIVYSLCHMAVDFSCAFLLFSAPMTGREWMLAVLGYNFCAFALQMPAGLVADRLGRGRGLAAVGCLLVAIAAPMRSAPLLLAVTAGLGNALFHVGGGEDILCLSGGKSGILGIFVSPGAIGLYIGTLMGRAGSGSLWLPVGLMAAAAAAIFLWCGGEREPDSSGPDFTVLRGGMLWAAALLFLVVCLRSWGGMTMSFPWKSGWWALAAVLCTAGGKALGGILADRWGRKTVSIVSLLGAAVCLGLGRWPAFGTLGILLFNMTMPITLSAAAELFPRARGFSFGLLTFGLFLGFLPVWLGLGGLPMGWGYALIALVSLGLLLPGLKAGEKR